MNYMTTNMDAGNAVDAVRKVLKLTLEDITFLSLPGSDWAKDSTGWSYYTVNRKGLYHVINTYFNVYDTDIADVEFDASRMFTTSSRNTQISQAYNSAFDAEAYEADLEGADDIKDENDKGEHNLPTFY